MSVERHTRRLDSTRRALDYRFARTAREIAATAEEIAATYEHLSHETGETAEARADWFRCRADAERREARRLWELADKLDD